MRETIHVVLAFSLAFVVTFITMNGQISLLLMTIHINKYIVILTIIIVAIIFSNKLTRGLREINRYSWLIIGCYLSATLAIEYQTYKFSVPFEGMLMTAPLVIAFIFWSQKNNKLLCLRKSEITKIDGFKIDIFLITTSFLLAGCFSLIVGLDNSDLRAFWPFLIILISLYGFIFSFIYSIIALALNDNHKRYTLLFMAIIVSTYSTLSLFPKNIWLFNLMGVGIFYAISIILFSIHLLVMLACHLNMIISKKTSL